MLVKCIVAPKPNALREGEKFEVGKQYELTEDSANRWIRRGVMFPAEPEKPKKIVEASNEPKPDSSAGGKPGNSGRGKESPAG